MHVEWLWYPMPCKIYQILFVIDGMWCLDISHCGYDLSGITNLGLISRMLLPGSVTIPRSS